MAVSANADRAARHADAPSSGGGGTPLLIGAAGLAGYGAWLLLKKPGPSTPPPPVPGPPPPVTPGNFPPGYSTRPSWFNSADVNTRESAQVFYDLLLRWPGQADAAAMAADIASCPALSVNCGNRAGIAAAAFYVIAAPAGEFIGDINTATAAISVPGGANWPGDWITQAYLRILGRMPDAGGLSYYASIFNQKGDVQISLMLTDSVEFANKITSEAAFI